MLTLTLTTVTVAIEKDWLVLPRGKPLEVVKVVCVRVDATDCVDVDIGSTVALLAV